MDLVLLDEGVSAGGDARGGGGGYRGSVHEGDKGSVGHAAR